MKWVEKNNNVWFLEVRNPSVNRATLLPTALGENPSSPLWASAGSRNSLVCSSITPLCLCLFLLSLLKDPFSKSVYIHRFQGFGLSPIVLGDIIQPATHNAFGTVARVWRLLIRLMMSSPISIPSLDFSIFSRCVYPLWYVGGPVCSTGVFNRCRRGYGATHRYLCSRLRHLGSHFPGGLTGAHS